MYKENFDELSAEFTPMIKSIIRDKFIDNYSKEDLIQECLIVLHNCNQSFDASHKTKFSTYFHTVATNRMYDLIREVNRSKRPKYIYAQELLDSLNDEDDPSDNSDMLEPILTHLKDIPRGDITYDIYIKGKTMEEVAKENGISKQRVHFLNKRNLEKLREILK
jgi:RNA polymerase sigma factor (sigma-70 family)